MDGHLVVLPILKLMGFRVAPSVKYEEAATLFAYKKGEGWSDFDVTFSSGASPEALQDDPATVTFEQFCDEYITDMANAIYL